jgi:hypothetical protein
VNDQALQVGVVRFNLPKEALGLPLIARFNGPHQSGFQSLLVHFDTFGQGFPLIQCFRKLHEILDAEGMREFVKSGFVSTSGSE